MTIDEIIKQITPIFIDIFEDSKIILKPETSSKDIEQWDSITYVQLIFEIEKHFKIKFTSTEIYNFKNVGEICNSIQSKLTKQK